VPQHLLRVSGFRVAVPFASGGKRHQSFQLSKLRLRDRFDHGWPKAALQDN